MATSSSMTTSTPPAATPTDPPRRTVGSALRGYFLSGLAVLLPIVVSGWVLLAVFQFADGLLGRHLTRWLGYQIPGIGLLLTICLVLLTGVFATHFFGRRLFLVLERLVVRLPIVRQVYPPAKQMTDMLFGKAQPSAFSRVVLVQYPAKGVYAVGFVTNESVPQIDRLFGKPMVAVLMPTTPTPLSGYFVYVPREEVVPLDLSLEEGLKLVISGGVIQPPIGASSRPRLAQS